MIDLDAVALLLLGAMNEVAMWIARAADPSAALGEAKAGLDRLSRAAPVRFY